jgi:hypothetical protein
MGNPVAMKTTLEMPDSVFRRAKATAARKGQSLAAFVTAAVEAKLASDTTAAREKPWMRSAGVFQDQREESRRILRRVEEECERVRPEDWA